jgi:hypothetical protein
MADKQSGLIVDYNPDKRIGRLVDKDGVYFFFHRHNVIIGEPLECADVMFLASKRPVRDGMLPTAVLIEVIHDITVSANALAEPNTQKADAKVGV